MGTVRQLCPDTNRDGRGGQQPDQRLRIGPLQNGLEGVLALGSSPALTQALGSISQHHKVTVGNSVKVWRQLERGDQF